MKRTFILLIFPLAFCLNLGCGVGVETTENLKMPSTSDTATPGETFTKDTLPEKQDADAVLSEALASAKSQNKNVFVHIGAPW